MDNLEYITDGKRHLICKPYSVDNLHIMATMLGIKRCWYHSGKNPHYDIPLMQQARIESKCTIVSSRNLVAIIKSSDPEPASLFSQFLPPLPAEYAGDLFVRNHPKDVVMEYDQRTGQPKYTAYHK